MVFRATEQPNRVTSQSNPIGSTLWVEVPSTKMVVVGIPPKKHVGKRAARLWIEDAYSHHLARGLNDIFMGFHDGQLWLTWWMMLIFYRDFARFTSSTAQGRGKSFKDRKPWGSELLWCMTAGPIHWWTEWWLELCFLEWLQWLQPPLLDVVWCSAAVVVVVVQLYL